MKHKISNLNIKAISRSYCVGIISCIIVFLLAIQGCKKEFLDMRQNPKIVKISASDCQALLDNYYTMNSVYPPLGEISADDYYLTAGADGGDGEQRAYRWDKTNKDYDFYYNWFYPYRVIYNANVVIQTIENDKNTISRDIASNLRGSALFFRAYTNLQLAGLYVNQYDEATAITDLGLPLRTSPDLDVEVVRSNAKETYDLIINDFKNASQLLPVQSSIQSRPNKIAALAALARTFLYMRNYAQAGVYADSCLQLYSELQNYNELDTLTEVPFKKFNKEVIFESTMAPAIILAPFLDARVDSTLYELFTYDDLRKIIFFKPTENGKKFTGNYAGFYNLTFFNGLAVDEIYLIRAECYARMGKKEEAMNDLNILLETRWKTNKYVQMIASTSSDALSLILRERRKQLLFRGIRWNDLRRLNKEVQFEKTLYRNISGVNYSLPPNDLRYTILLHDEALRYANFQQNKR